jgi:hypothetical protein
MDGILFYATTFVAELAKGPPKRLAGGGVSIVAVLMSDVYRRR